MDKKIIPCSLLMNDVHVSKDNIPEFEKNWQEALDICKENDLTEIIIGGDLWTSRASQTLSTLMAVSKALLSAHAIDIDVFIAEGNHCKVDQEAIDGYGHVFAPYPSVTVIDTWMVLKYDDCDMFVMSYFPENGSFQDKLNEILEDETFKKSPYRILYIHQGINGALSTPAEHELPASIFEDFDKVLVGHYHNRCMIQGTNIEYIGSSRQHNFGEDIDKGYTILYSDGSTRFIINTVNKRYHTLEIDAKNLNASILKEVEELKSDPRCLVKTKIKCDGAEAERIDKDALLAVGVSKIDIITEKSICTPIEIGRASCRERVYGLV